MNILIYGLGRVEFMYFNRIKDKEPIIKIRSEQNTIVGVNLDNGFWL